MSKKGKNIVADERIENFEEALTKTEQFSDHQRFLVVFYKLFRFG